VPEKNNPYKVCDRIQISLSNRIMDAFTQTANRSHLDPQNMTGDLGPGLFNLRIEHLADVG
jgi:hypothetical protein